MNPLEGKSLDTHHTPAQAGDEVAGSTGYTWDSWQWQGAVCTLTAPQYPGFLFRKANAKQRDHVLLPHVQTMAISLIQP